MHGLDIVCVRQMAVYMSQVMKLFALLTMNQFSISQFTGMDFSTHIILLQSMSESQPVNGVLLRGN